MTHLLSELRSLWEEALNDKAAGVSADDVLERLERKYQAMADAEGPVGTRST